jgi:hypothetical protein
MLQLPLNREQIEALNQDSVIDMSAMNFNNREFKDDVKSSLIFFRNTEVITNLDFSKCSYEQKKLFLLAYITDDIRATLNELTNTWAKILYGRELKVQSILTDSEYNQFRTEQYQLLLKITNFINAIPTASLAAIKELDNMYTPDWTCVEFDSSFSLFNLAPIVKLMNITIFIEEPLNVLYTNIPPKQDRFFHEVLYESGYISMLGMMLQSSPEEIAEISAKLLEKMKEENSENIC